MTLIAAASDVLAILSRHQVRGCLVGGLAVSTRCDPRFTRDVDVAVAVDNDQRAEALVRSLTRDGMRVVGLVEQEAVGRMAMARLSTAEGLSVDILIASSGIEAEIVAEAETLEVVRGVLLPVARTGHLIALKLLSVAPGRETDAADLRSLVAIADKTEWDRASSAVALIEQRGFARGRELKVALAELRASIT